jgi:hypothetical protein
LLEMFTSVATGTLVGYFDAATIATGVGAVELLSGWLGELFADATGRSLVGGFVGDLDMEKGADVGVFAAEWLYGGLVSGVLMEWLGRCSPVWAEGATAWCTIGEGVGKAGDGEDGLFAGAGGASPPRFLSLGAGDSFDANA